MKNNKMLIASLKPDFAFLVNPVEDCEAQGNYSFQQQFISVDDDEDILDRRSVESQQESAREEPFSKEVPEPISSS